MSEIHNVHCNYNLTIFKKHIAMTNWIDVWDYEINVRRVRRYEDNCDNGDDWWWACCDDAAAALAIPWGRFQWL